MSANSKPRGGVGTLFQELPLYRTQTCSFQQKITRQRSDIIKMVEQEISTNFPQRKPIWTISHRADSLCGSPTVGASTVLDRKIRYWMH